MKYRSMTLVLALVLALAACGDDDNANNGTATNNGTLTDVGSDATGADAGDEDVTTIGDVSNQEFDHRCGDAPITDWPLNEAVSSESASSSTADGVTTYTVEATAGGSGASAENPFIYLDLSTGEKVEVNDLEAYANSDWDLAFKRYIIRTNSQDSGPGDVSVAKIADTTFADVTAAPEASAFEQDVSYNDSCEPLTDPIGSLKTAFNHLNPMKNTGSWYEYPGLTPTEGDIYVVDVPEEATYKMEIEAWDDGVFTIHVAEL